MANENETVQTIHALADIATEENKLFSESLVKGVSEFVKECATPMTIAVQGDWGAGKTSFVNLIERELRAESESEGGDAPKESKYSEEIINVVIFDVWQQYVANSRINLFEKLFSEMISKLSGSGLETMQKVSEFASAASPLLDAMAEGDNHEDDSILGSILNSLFGTEKGSKAETGNETTTYEELESLRNLFAEALGQSAAENGKSENSRFVVFVDGLDHINPEAAIDFMEQIKAYIDSPRCVFVLAVDERTVIDGTQKRLGDKVDDRRRKLFFEKLVQVPLRIPTSAYNLEKNLKDLLKDEKELSGEFAKVIDALLDGPTPRSIKRYINTTYLYRSVFGGSENAGEDSLAMLFAATIVEIESKQGFDALVKCAQADEAHFDENLETVLNSLDVADGINWTNLPALWRNDKSGEINAAKRSAFLSWVRKLR